MHTVVSVVSRNFVKKVINKIIVDNFSSKIDILSRILPQFRLFASKLMNILKKRYLFLTYLIKPDV